MTSGPMPSPGRTATFISEVPGKLRLAARFEGADLVGVTQRETDLVEAVQQAVFAERIDVEMEFIRAVGGRNCLALQVDDQLEAGERGGVVEKLVDFRLREHDRQEPVLEGGVKEDVAELGRHHGAEAGVPAAPWGGVA